MPVQKPNKAESVRNQWTQQRKGEAQRSSKDASTTGGSHFAKPVSGDASLASSTGNHAKTAQKPSVAAGDSGQSHTTASRSALAKLPGLGETGETPKVEVAGAPTQSAGASGQSQAKAPAPKVPTHRTKRTSPQATPYSRYNNRYRSGTAASSPSLPAGMAAVPQEREPFAQAWLPFIVYGAVAMVVSIAWCVLGRTLTTGPIEPGSLVLTIGLVLLCVIVLAGIALAVVLAKFHADDKDLSFVDAFAPAIGKTALAMAAGVIVWIVSSAIVTL